MSIAIKTEHLSKRYVIRHQQKESYLALRDVIAEKTKNFFTSLAVTRVRILDLRRRRISGL